MLMYLKNFFKVIDRVINVNLGEKVKKARETRGLSTTELAKLSGLSQSYISELENGLRPSPTIKTIQKLAKALKYPAAYFIEEDVVTPFDIHPDIPQELKEFILDLDNMAHIKLTKKAKEEGIGTEELEKLIELFQIAKNNQSKK